MEAILKQVGSDPPPAEQGLGTGLPDECQRRHWLARGLGLWAEDLEVLADEGFPCYAATLAGIRLALCGDGLGAYLISPPAGEPALGVALALLKEHGLQGARGLEQDQWAAQRGWLKVAAGALPRPGRCSSFGWLYGDKAKERLSLQALEQSSAEVLDLFQRFALGPTEGQAERSMVVYPGQVVGRAVIEERGAPGRDVFGRPLAAPWAMAEGDLVLGPFVSLAGNGEVQAQRYGYLCLREGVLSVLSPLQLSAEGLYLYWVVLNAHLQPASPEMLRPWLEDLGLERKVAPDSLEAMLPQVAQGPGRYLLAQGQAPVSGKSSRLEILAMVLPPIVAGQQLRFALKVKAGEAVARRSSARQGAPGQDLRGRPLPVPGDLDHPIQEGAGVMSELVGDLEVFYATEEGVLKVTETKLSVEPTLVIEKDIGFSTGSLNFSGNIYIRGSVGRGFVVKASGDILIEGGVEDAAEVEATGSVFIGGGVIGRRAQVTAQEDIQVKFVQDGTLAAGRNILVGEAQSATLRAGNQVMSARRSGSAGVIAGGQVWALKRIVACQLGSAIGMPTMLVVGVNRKEAVRLDYLKRCMEESRKHIVQLLAKLGVSRIDAQQIKKLIEAASVPRRKVLMGHAKQLTQLAQLYQKFQGEYQLLDSQIGGVGELEIEVQDRIFPGVSLRLGKTTRLFSAVQEGGKFRRDEDSRPSVEGVSG